MFEICSTTRARAAGRSAANICKSRVWFPGETWSFHQIIGRLTFRAKRIFICYLAIAALARTRQNSSDKANPPNAILIRQYT